MERIGAAISEPNARAIVETIRRAEDLGVPAVWLTTGGGADGMTVFAAAAAATSTIRMGTSIVPTFPRHPLVTAQQAADIASLAPGRFTLGVGPSHGPAIEGRYGLKYERPLEHLREYVTILKQALSTGSVDFQGKRFAVRSRMPHNAEVPVIISALRERSFELAGEVADGAVTWICPAPYLRRVALPALQRGAQRAGRPVPPLIAHAFVCVTDDPAASEEACRAALAGYPRLPNYANMFAAASYAEALNGELSGSMVEAVALRGNEADVAERAKEFLEASGAEQLILSVLPAGPDRAAATDRALRFIAGL